jgi:hypothetical protein
MMNIRRLTDEDLPRLRQFWIEHWGDEEMVTRGMGSIARNSWKDLSSRMGRSGSVTYTFFIKDGECEVTSLDSLREGQGIGH